MVAARAKDCPDSVALVWDGGSLTYCELIARAARLAHLLRGAGVGPEVPVALFMPRGADTIVAVLAILQAGGAYVPIDPDDVDRRQRTILADAGCPILLVSGGSLGPPPQVAGVTVIDVEAIGPRLRQLPADPPDVPVSPANLAYIMYTSGSTGVPKGVLVQHGSIMNLVLSDFTELGAEQTLCAINPLAFDASTFEIWASLGNGARLAIAPPGLLGVHQIARTVARHRVTTLVLAAGLFNVVAEAAAEPMSCLRHLLVGGDVLSPAHARRAIKAWPDTRLANGYGPTEATTFTVVYPDVAPSLTAATAPTAPTAAEIPVGRPFPGVRVYILNESLRPVRPGEPGELFIAGRGLARGYTDPVATALRFLPDPHPGFAGQRMYRTGDVVRQEASGDIVFLRRTDSQVKVRGHRVEPRETEHVLRGLAGVRDVCCVPRPGPSGELQLAAYVAGDGITTAGLRAYASEHLPVFLRPAWIRLVPELPLTRNGKVDQSALPPLGELDIADAAVAGTARTASQAYLCGLLSEYLGCADVSVTDEFVAVGGHSLAAMRIAVRVRRDLGADIPIGEFFAGRTIAELAAQLDLLAGKAPVPAAPSVPSMSAAGAERETAPLSAFQRGLWLLHQVYPDCVAYNVPVAWELSGQLDIDALRRALSWLAERHGALRTTFPVEDGQPTARIATAGRAELPVVDLRDVPPAARDDALRDGLADVVRTPFELTTGPLWRAAIYTTAPDRHYLLLVVHHLVTDGWSTELLQRDLSRVYGAARRGDVPRWPDRAPQFADVAVWEATADARDQVQRELAFWRQHLGEHPAALRLPARTDRPATVTFAGQEMTAHIRAETVSALRTVAHTAGAANFSVILSAFALLLSRHCGQDRFRVGVPVSVRDRPELEDVVGFLTNTLVLTCEVGPAGSFLDLVRRTQRHMAAALAHPHVPFETLVADLMPAREPTSNPLFRVWFNMLTYDRHPLLLEGLDVAAVRPPLAGALFDLSVYVENHGSGIDVTLTYNPDVFAADRIDAMLDQFRGLLDLVGADPGQELAKLRPPGAATHRSTAEFAARPAGTLARRAALRAAADDPAITCGAKSVSYARLASEAKALADSLREYGVGSGHLVAVRARRVPELITAMLGIRQAGASFALIDLDYPPSRVAEMLRLTQPRAIVSPSAGRFPDKLAATLAPDAPPPDARGACLPPEAAYIMVTSGSTGRPREVVGTEAALTTFFTWYAGAYGLTGQDRFSVLAGLSHDPVLRETLLPLWIGATACVPEPENVKSPRETVRWIADTRVTVVHLTPAKARLLTGAASAMRATIPNVRVVALGGDAVYKDDHDALTRLFPRARLIAFYGATETPQGVSVVDLATEFASGKAGGYPPIGAGSPSAEIGVLGPGLTQASVSEIGEVYVRSPYLALGYRGEPELTAARFAADPWGDPGVRIYRTGDEGRYRPDKSVEFLGRLDDQVSVGGHRVEPAEIENTLCQHPAVAECAATAVAGAITVVVRPRDKAVTAEALRRHLSNQIPAAMVPERVVIVDDIPLTPNGKIDRDAIRDHVLKSGMSPTAPDSDADQITRDIASIWCEVLGVSQVDPDRNFFAVGGTSFGLLQVHRLVRERIDKRMELADLFRFPTVRKLAESVLNRKRGVPRGAGKKGE